jgi:hypothetical protein
MRLRTVSEGRQAQILDNFLPLRFLPFVSSVGAIVVKSGCFDIKVAKLMQRVRGKHGRGNFFRGSRASRPSAKLVLQRAPTTSKHLHDNFQHVFNPNLLNSRITTLAPHALYSQLLWQEQSKAPESSTNMAPIVDMSDKNAWNDQDLIDSWDDAVNEYKAGALWTHQ